MPGAPTASMKVCSGALSDAAAVTVCARPCGEGEIGCEGTPGQKPAAAMTDAAIVVTSNLEMLIDLNTPSCWTGSTPEARPRGAAGSLRGPSHLGALAAGVESGEPYVEPDCGWRVH